LVHRSREELARQRPAAPSAVPVVTPAQFDAALAAVEAKIVVQASARAVFLDVQPAPPIKACDLGTVDMMVAEVEGLKEYRLNGAAWQRVAVPRLAIASTQWTHAPDEPVALAVPSNALRAGAAARLNLIVQPVAVCDPRVHPEVMHQSAQGRLTWRGRDTARLSLALYALPPEPPDPKLGPDGIAAPTVADAQQLHIASCGLRDAGAPFGDVALELRVYPATQWLTEIRHAGFPALSWPNPPAGAAPNSTACKLEADGTARDAQAWQRGWAALPTQFRAGMEKLFNAWAREVDGNSARLEVEASPLVGQGGLTWGWRRTAADTVVMRTEGQLELLACALDLRLAGEVSLGATRARVTLACKGRSELRVAVEQLGDVAEDGKGLAAVKRSWRFPFSLEVEPLASGELGMLYALPPTEGMLGAIAGECGLRPRPDGKGLQWYFTLRAEPAAVLLACVDPVVGGTRRRRSLLPALPLVDWSAG